jgi:DNA-binding CsgD family transcriptional regulator/tetratricopeptide (TPR) repeat protein
LRLVGALLYYWRARGHLNEARRWANTALAGASSRTLARANALRAAGWLAKGMDNSTTARARLEESAAIHREWGEAGRWGLAETLNLLGLNASQCGDNFAAQKYLEESLDLRRAVGNLWGIAQSLNNLGSVATERGDYEVARSLLAEGLATARVAGDKGLVSLLLWAYGDYFVAQGDDTLARSHWAEGLRICQELGDIWRAVGLMESVAEFEARSSQTARFEKAARLWGATEALLTARGDAGLKAESFDRDVAAAHAQLGEARFEAAWAEGATMMLNEAIDYALDVLEASSTGGQSTISPRPRRATKQQFGGLTKREREVATLVAQGKSNREIAQTLVLSEYTVASHVSSILSKLEFSSRTQIVSWAIEKGLARLQ